MKFFGKMLAIAVVAGAMGAGSAQAFTTGGGSHFSGKPNFNTFAGGGSSNHHGGFGGGFGGGSGQGGWQGGGQSGGPSAVPVPASLPLFLGGMALLGLIGHRRRNQKTV